MAGAEIGALLAKLWPYFALALAAIGALWWARAASRRRDSGVEAKVNLDTLKRMGEVREAADNVLDQPAPTGPEIPARWRARAQRHLDRRKKEKA